MIQQSHSWVYIQKHWKKGLGEIMVYRVHRCIIHNSQKWKQPKCSPTDKWISKMQYIQIMEYYLPFKRKKNISCASAWVNLEDIMLLNNAVKEKQISVLFHLYVSRVAKFTGTESRRVIPRAWGDGEMQPGDIAWKPSTWLQLHFCLSVKIEVQRRNKFNYSLLK